MLDKNIEKSKIAISIPRELGNIISQIRAIAKSYNLGIYDLEELEEGAEFPQNIVSAIIYNDNRFSSGVLIAEMIRQLQKIIVLTDVDFDVHSDAIEIYNIKYKKLGERIRGYVEDMLYANTSIMIDETAQGYAFHSYGNIRINPYKGLFIAIDYPDNSIGTKVSLQVAEQLEKEHLQVYYTNEPTSEISGGIIKSATAGKYDIGPDALQLLYTIDRIEHARIIHKKLKEGNTVVTARYALSTLAYSFGNLPLGFLVDANSQVYWPDIGFVLTSQLPSKDKHASEIMQGLAQTTRMFAKTTHELSIDRPVEIISKQSIRIIKNHHKYKKVQSTKGAKT